MRCTCGFLLLILACFWQLPAAAQEAAADRDAFLERPLHLWLGPVVYRHTGAELSAAYFHRKGWMTILRSWSYGYGTDDYPTPAPGMYGRDYPFDFFELSGQYGRYTIFAHHFVAFATAGPGYVKKSYPTGHDTTFFTYGPPWVQIAKKTDRAIALGLTGGVGWRQHSWGVLVLPAAAFSKIKTYASVSVLLTLTIHLGQHQTE